MPPKRLLHLGSLLSDWLSLSLLLLPMLSMLSMVPLQLLVLLRSWRSRRSIFDYCGCDIEQWNTLNCSTLEINTLLAV